MTDEEKEQANVALMLDQHIDERVGLAVHRMFGDYSYTPPAVASVLTRLTNSSVFNSEVSRIVDFEVASSTSTIRTAITNEIQEAMDLKESENDR